MVRDQGQQLTTSSKWCVYCDIMLYYYLILLLWILFMAVCRIMPGFFATQINSHLTNLNLPLFPTQLCALTHNNIPPKQKSHSRRPFGLRRYHGRFQLQENDEEYGGVFVQSLKEDSAAAAVLQLGDQLVLGVNVLKVSGMAFDEALSAIVESTGSDTPKLILFRASTKQLYGGRLHRHLLLPWLLPYVQSNSLYFVLVFFYK